MSGVIPNWYGVVVAVMLWLCRRRGSWTVEALEPKPRRGLRGWHEYTIWDFGRFSRDEADRVRDVVAAHIARGVHDFAPPSGR